MREYESYKKGYLKGADGNHHKVSEEVWNDYMCSVWREQAAQKRDRSLVNGKKAESPGDSWNYFPRVVSYDSITDSHGEEILSSHESMEDGVIVTCVRTEIHDRLYRALEQLGPEEKFLIGKLYLEGEGMSIREYAEKYGKPRTTVQYQRIKLMKKLRALLEQEEGFSLDLV